MCFFVQRIFNWHDNDKLKNTEHTFDQENNLELPSTDHCVPSESTPCLTSLKVISLIVEALEA